jgi:hypothetical protein
LITRQTSSIHGRPVGGVADDRAVAACHLGKVVPVVFGLIQGYIAVS